MPNIIVKCLKCGVQSNLTPAEQAIYELPCFIKVGYFCPACKEPIILRWVEYHLP